MTARLEERYSDEYRDPLVGRVLQERYEILGVLGRGGMGIVYRARHVLIDRVVAVKMLQPQLTASQELVQRFHREARAAALTGNEHVVDVTDMGRLDDGSYFIVLEYLEGADLAQLVANGGPLSVERAIAIALQICVALEAVHGAGIVHRDLKPENVFLVERRGNPDFVKILDFGICKYLKDRALTATGVALGTPRFMSPEQLEARPEIDARADVYGVGAILFFALTGQGPFDRESLPRLLVSIWSDPAPRLTSFRPQVPEALEALVARALEKAPERRFGSASELRAALETFSRSDPLPAEPHWASASGVRQAATLQPSIPGLRRTRRFVTAALAVSVLLACALIVGLLWPAAAPQRPVTSVRPALPPATAPLLQPERLEQPEQPAREPAAAPKPATPSPGRRTPRRSAAPPEVPREQSATVEEPAPVPAEPEPDPPAHANSPARVEPQLVPAPQQLKRVF